MQSFNSKAPQVMGILNVTPDSFFDGGNHDGLEAAVFQAKKMLDEGATIIDIGGYSSRPGAEHVSEQEELKRVLPVVEAIVSDFPEAIISVDTFRANVAKEVIGKGAHIINDISGGTIEPEIMKVTAEANAYYVMMHMRGTPQTMQQFTNYSNVAEDVVNELSDRLKLYPDTSKVILDPGFGFSKTLEQNYELLKHLDLLQELGCPILAGVSRKSMIYKLLDCLPQEALNATTALNMVALQKGASILRVHDVKEAVECVKLNSIL